MAGDSTAAEHTLPTHKQPLKSRSLKSMPTERTALLADTVEAGDISDLEQDPQLRSPAKVLATLFACLLFISWADILTEYTNVKIYESVVCYRYYEQHNPRLIKLGRERVSPGAIGGVDEMWCKADAVAAELAALLGYQQFFDGLLSLCLSLPVGAAADRYGRRPFLLLGLAGLALRTGWMRLVTWHWQVFDVRWTWLSAAFSLPAGGSVFIATLFFVCAADLAVASARAATFFRLGAVNVSANLLMPPLVAWLMEISPWLPAFLGLGLAVLAVGLGWLVPETLNFQHSDGLLSEQSDPVSPVLSDSSLPPVNTKSTSPPQTWAEKLQSSTEFLTRDWRVVALVLPFFTWTPIASTTQLLLQFISKRFQQRLSQASLIITTREAVHVALLFVILPYLSVTFLRLYRNCEQTKDLFLARSSQLLTSVGWLVVGLAPNILVLVIGLALSVLGLGASILTRSFLTSLLPPHHVARVFALIGIVASSGQMLGAPIFAALFKRGMAYGGVWIGLPFMVISAICGAVTVLLFCIRLRKGEGSDEGRHVTLIQESEAHP